VRLRQFRFDDVLFSKDQFEPWTTRAGELLSIDTNSPQYKQPGGVSSRARFFCTKLLCAATADWTMFAGSRERQPRIDGQGTVY
jgi:hypothetical protein